MMARKKDIEPGTEFQTLLGKLLKVPKTEADRAAKRIRRERKKKK
jgi:hypothetical protein